LAGKFTEFKITAGSSPHIMRAGPKDSPAALWFTETGSGHIGHITTGGSYTDHTPPTLNSQPYFLAVGPDNDIWFTELATNKIAVYNGI
jgi:virginiamycin B lyase